MTIEFKRLPEIDRAELIELMNNPLVRRQMPLLNFHFDESICNQFIAAKEQLWDTHGYGPWAFMIDHRFAGWGGLQHEHGDADLAMVLHPDFWGVGKHLYKEIIHRAFVEMNLSSVTILLPPARTRIKAIKRLGFKPDGEVLINDELFHRYRLFNSK